MARPYTSRISVDDTYLEAVGQALFNFAYAEGIVAYLINTSVPGYINLTRGRTADEIANDLQLASSIVVDEEMSSVATKFQALTEKRHALLLAIPITAGKDSAQILGTLTNVEHEWDEPSLWRFAEDSEDLAIEASELYHRKSAH